MTEDIKDAKATKTDYERAVSRYRSLGSAVKANDAEALKAMVGGMRDELLAEMATSMLWLSADNVIPEIAAFLVEKGADPRASEIDPDHRTGINVAFKAATGGNAALLAWLLDQGHACVNDVDTTGRSLLTHALIHRQLAVADLLFERQADLDKIDLHERTALHYAAVEYQVASIVWLVQHGANPEKETIEGTLASEIIPEQAALGPEWKPSALYEFLEDYRAAYKRDPKRAAAIPIPRDVQEEVALERGPDAPVPDSGHVADPPAARPRLAF